MSLFAIVTIIMGVVYVGFMAWAYVKTRQEENEPWRPK